MDVMMKCGHLANARRAVDPERTEWLPVCAICAGINDDALEVDHDWKPDPNRQAICCSEKTLRPSTDADRLAFFEYRGEGSKHATDLCTCGYTRAAHEKPHVQTRCAEKNKDTEGFRPRGPHQYDKYYCGCRGWD